MGLHARQMAMAAGAKGELVERIAHTMVDEGEILLERAQALLKQME
jgi:hydroxymethylglutaryl-CoA reductase